MENKKTQLLAALKRNVAQPIGQQQDEDSVGESVGLSGDELEQVLAELLKEGKVEYRTFGICNHVPTGS